MEDNLTKADRHMIDTVLIQLSGWMALAKSSLTSHLTYDEVGDDLQRRCTELMVELDRVRAYMMVAPGVQEAVEQLYIIGEAVEHFGGAVVGAFGNDPDDIAEAWKTQLAQIHKILRQVRNLSGKQTQALSDKESLYYGKWKFMKERLESEGQKHTIIAVHAALIEDAEIPQDYKYEAFKRIVNRASEKLEGKQLSKTERAKGTKSIDTGQGEGYKAGDGFDQFHSVD